MIASLRFGSVLPVGGIACWGEVLLIGCGRCPHRATFLAHSLRLRHRSSLGKNGRISPNHNIKYYFEDRIRIFVGVTTVKALSQGHVLALTLRITTPSPVAISHAQQHNPLRCLPLSKNQFAKVLVRRQQNSLLCQGKTSSSEILGDISVPNDVTALGAGSPFNNGAINPLIGCILADGRKPGAWGNDCQPTFWFCFGSACELWVKML